MPNYKRKVREMKKIKVAVVAAGSRSSIYSGHMATFKDEAEIFAIAEPIDRLRNKFKEKHGISDENTFKTYDEMFAKGKIADAVIIGTQDNMHFDPCMKAMDAGYKYILIEKPISPSMEECVTLYKTAKEKGVNIQVCHSLRYAPFYRKLKEIIDSGVIGDIVTINHTEGVGEAHQSHSFVRGDWRNSKECCPMILAKCCHDADLMLYLTGKDCHELSSYGSTYLFKKENAPEGSTDRCIEDCKVKDTCPYNCFKVYTENEWMKGVAVDKKGYDDLYKAMAENQYGRCVYRCDNDVVDHQVVNFLLDDGVTAHLTMTAFQNGRVTNIGGTMGRIHAEFEKQKIVVTDFRDPQGAEIEYTVGTNTSGHGGADYCMARDFIKTVRGETDGYTNIAISLQSHAMCHAAEKSRLENRNVKIDEFLK